MLCVFYRFIRAFDVGMIGPGRSEPSGFRACKRLSANGTAGGEWNAAVYYMSDGARYHVLRIIGDWHTGMKMNDLPSKRLCRGKKNCCRH